MMCLQDSHPIIRYARMDWEKVHARTEHHKEQSTLKVYEDIFTHQHARTNY
jgi:hypothetical protein